MKSLQDTLCNRFGFEFEQRESTLAGIDLDDLKLLTDKIQELRHSNKKQSEIRAENDALHILRVQRVRSDEEKAAGNPFGYKTWWITQETTSGKAAALVFPARKESRYIMRPEFLINYIAYNPTTEAVRQSLKTIFPSLLGVRLGSRLDKHVVHSVLKHISDVQKIDPARASALITEHSDSLKSNQMRNFVIKYLPAVDTTH